ncbi:MAG: Crp/Fnr family transcriptional regulator [Acidobacteriaceae bacterium]
MGNLANTAFDPAIFLASAGRGRTIIRLNAKETFFSQGDPADSIFYLHAGRARLTVVSAGGKEATVTLASAGEFVGEESIAVPDGPRMASAVADTPCTALRIGRNAMLHVMQEEQSLANLFLDFLLTRSMRLQEDLIDQLFNCSEKRLARILLLMANFEDAGPSETLIPPITQETLADMIGASRPRVSLFMNRFRKLGLIEYDGRIRVHKSLVNVILNDPLPEQNAA